MRNPAVVRPRGCRLPSAVGMPTRLSAASGVGAQAHLTQAPAHSAPSPGPEKKLGLHRGLPTNRQDAQCCSPEIPRS